MKFLKYLLLFAFILLLASCSTGYPATELEGEEPIVIGHIIEVLEEKQIILVVEGITKEEAMEIDLLTYELDIASFASNETRFEGKYKKGDKVAIWKIEEGPETVGAIAEKIVLLEK
ncbi:hypothetical protein [Planococcus halocryophilus]|uniref:hypothetical protein n=1 Tax=Planococcus halocryophilus TaxID=1215089 RepID=UPI001F0EFAAC|nr:hypothetical protein [Planococcus halocryophilus]MCH4825220.1 hypothetical protein [Planococcus halocryophilus]